MVYVAVAMLVTNTIASLGVIVVRYEKQPLFRQYKKFHPPSISLGVKFRSALMAWTIPSKILIECMVRALNYFVSMHHPHFVISPNQTD